jgi:hypothetical protein
MVFFGTNVYKIYVKHDLCKIAIYLEVKRTQTVKFQFILKLNALRPLQSTPYFTPLSKFGKIFLPDKLDSVLIFLIQGRQ